MFHRQKCLHFDAQGTLQFINTKRKYVKVNKNNAQIKTNAIKTSLHFKSPILIKSLSTTQREL